MQIMRCIVLLNSFARCQAVECRNVISLGRGTAMKKWSSALQETNRERARPVLKTPWSRSIIQIRGTILGVSYTNGVITGAAAFIQPRTNTTRVQIDHTHPIWLLTRYQDTILNLKRNELYTKYRFIVKKRFYETKRRNK